MDAEIAEACRCEVVDLHRFFVDWYTGVAKRVEQVWARLPEALGPRFTMITPEGTVVMRKAVLDQLRTAHACHGPERGFNIWIEDFECRRVTDQLVVATYQEWQKLDGNTKGRLSTVIFQRDPEGSNGVRWLHVHETWLPE